MKKNVLFIGMLLVVMMMVACGAKETANDDEKDGTAAEETEELKDDGEKEVEVEEETSFIPSEPLDWTIAFGPGGGNDVMARTLISILEKYELYPEAIVPTNREGGSGAIGWGHLHRQAGSAVAISTTSGSFITTPLMSDPGFTHNDFTHIALMATDDMFFLVPGNSEIDTLEEFIEYAKTKKLNVGGMGIGNVDGMIVTTFAKEADIPLEYVPYDEQGLVLSDLLSGTTDAMVSNPGDVPGQIAAGELKALAFTGQQRLPGEFADIPTFIELGYDVDISMPRGIVLPPDVPDEVREYWIETMKKVAETPEWKEYINSNYLTEYILYGDDFSAYLDETVEIFESILMELGVLQ